MTDIHPAIVDIAPGVVSSICRRFRNFVDKDDVRQECYAWYLSRVGYLDELLNETNYFQRIINEKRIAWRMKRHCERYARKEKAAKSGYRISDEAFYDATTLVQLLPHIIASVIDNTVLEQAQNLINDGQSRKQSAPAEGGNLLATLIDIKNAYLKLEVADKNILIKRHHENLTLEAMAEYLGCAISTADRKCQASLRKLQNNLGGESPW